MPITQKVRGAWGMSEGAVMVVTVPESCMEILIGIHVVMGRMVAHHLEWSPPSDTTRSLESERKNFPGVVAYDFILVKFFLVWQRAHGGKRTWWPIKYPLYKKNAQRIFMARIPRSVKYS